MKRVSLKYILLAITVIALSVWAAAVTIPNTFSEGEVLSASKMNANFTALAAADGGIEFTTLDSSFDLKTTVTSLGSVTLTAPNDGYILLMHNGSAVFFGDNTVLNYGLGTSPTQFDLYENSVGRLDGSGQLRYYHAYDSTAVVQASAGEEVTLYANAKKSSVFGSRTINLTSSHLIAVFVANRY